MKKVLPIDGQPSDVSQKMTVIRGRGRSFLFFMNILAKSNKASALKKKAKSFKIKYSKTSGSGKVSFKKVGKSTKNKLKVSKAGKITVKKGTKKGTYKIKVKMTVAANDKFTIILVGVPIAGQSCKRYTRI